MLTDYGELALCDFGIAHMSGAFKTAADTFTGSPAFAAPETLRGDPSSESSDVYGLGATLFAALTGHAAFERRSGEQAVLRSSFASPVSRRPTCTRPVSLTTSPTLSKGNVA